MDNKKGNNTKGSQGKKRPRTAEQNTWDYEDTAEPTSTRRQRLSEVDEKMPQLVQLTAGKVKKIKLHNFMCHELLEFDFGDRINFLSGKNGSGKSAILTALVIGLGGRTSDTNRGHSLKSLIKNGQNSGFIEITLSNEGIGAYKRDVYGNVITIVRKISEKSSTYKFLSEGGKLISSKKEELTFITLNLNIQINNPMCVLNQDMARTFLTSTSPAQFYKLFRRGTLLEFLSNRICNILNERIPRLDSLHAKKQTELQESSKDLQDIKQILEEQKKLRKHQKELESIVNELLWSIVSALEKDIEKEEKIIEDYKTSLEELSSKVKRRDAGVDELKRSQKTLEEKLIKIKHEKQEKNNELLKTENDYLQTKEQIKKKVGEIKKIESKKTNALKNYQDIKDLIANQENRIKEAESILMERKGKKQETLNKYEELKAVLLTTEVHRQQLLDTVDVCNKTLTQKSRFTDNLINTIRHKENYLSTLKKGKNELSVYTSWMPELIAAIRNNERKFDQMPRGPLGIYIKLKDERWGPAIEAFLGKDAFCSFSVHNSKDYKVLDGIFESLNIPKKQRPSITISKFFSKVHDITPNETKTKEFSCLFRALIVSDPVVSNTLIDQWRMERVLLIPTNREAYPLMEEITMVPPNCERVLTLTGDTFYPQPSYRSYSGTVKEQARFLQANPEKIISLTEVEIKTMKSEYKLYQDELQELDKKFKTARKGLDAAEREIQKLTTNLANCEVQLIQIDQEVVPECFDSNVLNDDLKHWEGQLEACQQSIKEIQEKKDELSEKTKEFKTRLIELEKNTNEDKEKITETEKELMKVKCEYRKINENHDHYKTLATNEECKYESHKKKLKELQSGLAEAKKKAVEACSERIEFPRKGEELKKKQTEILRTIKALQKIIDDKEIVEPADFQLRMNNFESALNTLHIYGDFKQALRSCLEYLPGKLEEIALEVGEKTNATFQSILSKKHFVGKLHIDYENEHLNILIKPDPKAKVESSISSLSGGERSFSMVALIVALWENMKSPFYFLDEFDVFMDELNRKIVMDLLISIAKARPNHQYVFLTPHSIVSNDDCPDIKFFRMKDPREG